jgi:hypothetical protein
MILKISNVLRVAKNATTGGKMQKNKNITNTSYFIKHIKTIPIYKLNSFGYEYFGNGLSKTMEKIN